MLPDFVCVGPGRSGTSWLYEVLLEHPQVCMAKNIKETQFFDVKYNKGIGWYEGFFSDCAGAGASGEISNRYIFDPAVPSRINKHIPGCKILICLRNPYDRIQSVYSFKLREGALSCSFTEALSVMPELVEENRYYTLIKPYYDMFGAERICFVLFDDISERPREFCKRLFGFLGVAEDFVPGCLERQVNKAVVPRFPMVSLLTKGAARIMRSIGLHRPLTWAKRSDAIKGVLFRDFDYDKKELMTGEVREILDPVFIPEIERLEGLLGMKFDAWRKETHESV